LGWLSRWGSGTSMPVSSPICQAVFQLAGNRAESALRRSPHHGGRAETMATDMDY
jgi:hypothetical protein